MVAQVTQRKEIRMRAHIIFFADRVVMTQTDGRLTIRTVLAIETYRRLFGP